MLGFMTRWQPHCYALLRIVMGYLFFWHGSQKLLGFPASPYEAPAYITWVAGPIELIGGALVLLGWWTRPAAFLSSGLMAVAYFTAHALPQGSAWLPLANGGEPAAIYCFVMLYVSAKGAGIWSLEGD